jgi:hypothetical protein
MTDEIAGLDAAQLGADYTIAVIRKAMDTQALAGQELTRMLAGVPDQSVGSYIDTYA